MASPLTSYAPPPHLPPPQAPGVSKITMNLIHWCILNTPGPQVIDAIKNYHASYPYMIYQRDGFGVTPLELAFRINNRFAAEAIQQLDMERRTVAQTQRPMAPVPSLLETKLLRLLRLVKIQNDGYPMDELTQEFAIKRVPGMPVRLEDYIEQRKWGCMCGKCTEGWLSPRMRYRLAYASDVIEESVNPTSRSSDNTPNTIPAIKDIKAYGQGFKSILSTTRVLLQTADMPINKAVIASHSRGKPGVGSYLQDGGTIEGVLDPLTSWVWRIMSDAYVREEFEADISQKENGGDVYKALPVCSNDLNFALVRRRLGLAVDDCESHRGVGDEDMGGLLLASTRVQFIEQLLSLRRAGEL
ncbi:hypothetical protein C0991_000626 [Blastosporella zonata]|nr:hypothetical protein C0991_000626 [Blastosporella zonata]